MNMKKLIKLSLIAALGLVVAFAGCKKYEDGPAFSLASAKSRVVNEWKMEKVIENGVDVTSAYAALSPGFSIEFKKDNTYAISYFGFTLSTAGKWDFDSNKENLLMTPTGSTTAETNKILRLTSKEMWLEGNDSIFVVETHYASK
jgi:hypothetical protein